MPTEHPVKTDPMNHEAPPQRKPYVAPRVEKKRSVQRVTLVSGDQNMVSSPTTPPPAA